MRESKQLYALRFMEQVVTEIANIPNKHKGLPSGGYTDDYMRGLADGAGVAVEIINKRAADLPRHDEPGTAAPTLTRSGPWIQTYTGARFYAFEPRTEDINITDVAHALSMLCRYNGHCIRFESVAEHCVLLVRHLARINGDVDHQKWALLHDAAEAYISDVTRPVKPYLKGFSEIESGIMTAVARRFGLSGTICPDLVRRLDTRFLADERDQNLRFVEWDADPGLPLGIDLQFWTPAMAEEEFMYEFHRLFGPEV